LLKIGFPEHGARADLARCAVSFALNLLSQPEGLASKIHFPFILQSSLRNIRLK